MSDPVRPVPEEADVAEPVTQPAPARDGCGRAGCGFLAGVLGSALITVLILATVLTQGHPLAFVSRLARAGTGTPSPASAPSIGPALALASREPSPTAAVTRPPTPTFIPVPTAIPTRTPTPTPTATPTPMVQLRQINELGRYETTQFIVQTVVDLSHEPANLWERICGTDQLLLVAGGQVIAGFDLAKVGPGDLQVQGKSLKLVLPPAEVFSYFVKEDQTYVYQRNTGLLCRPDKNLETEARQQAEQRLLHYALEQGILEKAQQSGVSQLEAFFKDLGFEQVQITVRPGD